jgi:hypothetical protein
MLKGRRITRCQRNTFLLFGFLIVLTLLFLPYKREAYVTSDSMEARIPEKYGNPGEGTPGILALQQLDQKGLKFFPFFVSDAIHHRKFLKWKDRTMEEGEQIRSGKEVLETEDIYYLEREFYKKYDGIFTYDKFWLEFYLTEILVILFTAGFSYILFCILLRKKKKVVRYRSSRSPK